MYMLKGGAVPVPRWILIFRAAQLFFAILVLILTAYALSVHGGGPVQPALIADIIIAVLTIVPILILATPLHISQRKIYDPRIALLLDGFATLFWLGALTAMASYQRIFHKYFIGDADFPRFFGEFNGCRRCRRAWRSATSAAWFSAVEFFLFLFTTLLFIYYYHCELAGIAAPGLGSHGSGKAATATSGAAANEATASQGTEHGSQHHEMSSMPSQSPVNSGTHRGPTSGAFGNTQQQSYNVPYPTTSPRE